MNRFRVSVFSLLLGASVNAIASVSLTDLEMLGRYAELEQAAEHVLAGQSGAKTSLLGPLCLAYSRVKRYGQLFSCLDRLEQQIKAGDSILETDKSMVSDSDATPLADMLRAEAHIELGDYRKAIDEAQAALASVQDRLPYGLWAPKRYRLSLLGILGLAYALEGDRTNALASIKQLEDFSIGFLGSAMFFPLRANALARIHMALGQYPQALSEVKDEDSVWRRSVWFLNNAAWGYSGDDGVEVLVLLPRMLMRAKCQSEAGALDEAKQILDAMLRNARIPDQGELYWLALFERGRIAEQQGNPGEGISYYARAVAVIEVQRATINTEANKIGFVGDKQAVYGRLISLLIDQGRSAEALDYVERSKSRALVDMLAAKKDFAAQDPAQAGRVLAQLDAADLRVRVQDGSVRPEEKTADMRNMQAARQALQSLAPELSTLVAVSSVPAAELQSLLGHDETLVEYYYQGKDLYAFILDRERLLSVRLDVTELASQVQGLRQALAESDSPQWQAGSRGLYQRLWKPLESLVTGKNLIVIAHGALHYLPFAALQDSAGNFLIDRYAMRFLPSASVLRYLRPVMQKKEAPLLVLGNPDLGDPRMDLEFAESEAKRVGSMNPKSRVLLRKDASESNFNKAAGFFSRIHFATHGKFQADQPLKSGLYLARDEENDGVLTVGELYSTTLDADLVTLSACETGLGKIASGDDVVGLTRGFLYAGSRSIVASLWNVDDKATAELMQAFYENLASMNKSDALRQAQIKTRQSYPHPLYWAAFQLTGRAE